MIQQQKTMQRRNPISVVVLFLSETQHPLIASVDRSHLIVIHRAFQPNRIYLNEPQWFQMV